MEHHGRRGPLRSAAATLVALLMLLAALSLWTAIPLLWLYIGSKLSHTQFPSTGPYLIVLAGVIFSIIVMAWVIGRLNRLYTRLTGTTSVAPIRLGWMRDMTNSSYRPQGPSLMEVVVIGSVLIAAVAMAAWFFLLAGSPLPN